MDRCVEVVVHFAGTIVQIHRIKPGARCRIGRSRDAEIALDVPAFTLVHSTPQGFLVQRGRGTQPLEPGVPIDLAFGDHVTLTLSLVAAPRISVPRARVERRPFVFGAASIAAHAGLLLAALWAASPDDDTVPGTDTTKRRPARIARFAVAAQTTKREKAPPPLTTPITTDTTPSPAPALDEPSAAAIRSPASAARPHGRGSQIEPAPESTEVLDDSLSNPRSFDPSTSPAFDTVKVGNYTTVSTGRAAGERFELAGANGQRKPLIVVSCDAASCLVIGGDAANSVRRGLESRLPDIVKCYADHAATAGKKVEVDFGIDESGKVEAVNVGGVGDYDSCVAEIVRSIQFASSQ